MPLYNRRQVQQLTGLDLSQGMLDEAQAKVQHDGQGLQISLRQGQLFTLANLVHRTINELCCNLH